MKNDQKSSGIGSLVIGVIVIAIAIAVGMYALHTIDMYNDPPVDDIVQSEKVNIDDIVTADEYGLTKLHLYKFNNNDIRDAINNFNHKVISNLPIIHDSDETMSSIDTATVDTDISNSIKEDTKKDNEKSTEKENKTEKTEEKKKCSYTDEDLEYLAKVMYCEAGSSWITDEQQMLFGAVVLNRVASPEFPNTIKKVVLQKGQYHPELFTKPDKRTYNNARRLLEGYDTGMPSSVVFQANFKQGSGVWKSIKFDNLGYTYFCHANNMKYYT